MPKKNNIKLEINQSDANCNIPLLSAIKYVKNNYNYKMVKLLIDYAHENKIRLKIDYRDLVLEVVIMNDIEIIRMLIDYAQNTNEILNIDDPHLWKTLLSNKKYSEIKNLIMDYAQNNKALHYIPLLETLQNCSYLTLYKIILRLISMILSYGWHLVKILKK